MTNDELALLFKVGASVAGYEPEPADLPVAEALVAHGVLRRVVADGQVSYVATDEFARKAERLLAHQQAAEEAARWN